MADFGIKISKDGVDVNTASDSQLVFSSEFNVLKIISQGSANIVHGTASGGTTSVAHNMNFTPTFLAFINSGGKYFSVGQSAGVNSDGNYIGMEGYTDSTNLTLISSISSFSSEWGSAGTQSAHYYIFGDTARETSTTTNFPSPTEDWGVKVSKDGQPGTTTVIENTIISSRMPSMMIKTVGGTSITSGGSAVIAHGLSFPPAFILMYSDDGTTYYRSPSQPNVDGPNTYGFSNGTNFYISSANFPGEIHYFKYIIFANPANPS